MPDLNEVRLIGRLTKDPELKNIKGLSITELSLATERKFKKGSGELERETTFVSISAFGSTAEAIVKYCAKGKAVYVGGRLKLEQWQDKQGQKHQKLLVVAENVQFLDHKDKDEKDPEVQSPPWEAEPPWESQPPKEQFPF